MKKVLLFILIILAFSACREEDPEPLGSGANPIRFDKLEVGQKSRYIRLQGEGGLSGAPFDFQYLKDTLVLEAIATADIGEGVTLLEYLTPGSSIFSKPADERVLMGGTDPLSVKVQVKNGELIFPKSAPGMPLLRLFLSGIEKFPLTPIQQPDIKMKGWQPDVAGLADVDAGRVTNHTQLGATYPVLNLLRDYRPMTYDGPGHFHLYSAENGIVRSGWVNPWTALGGEAWDLLPE